jgi:hypothetical protein
LRVSNSKITRLCAFGSKFGSKPVIQDTRNVVSGKFRPCLVVPYILEQTDQFSMGQGHGWQDGLYQPELLDWAGNWNVDLCCEVHILDSVGKLDGPKNEDVMSNHVGKTAMMLGDDSLADAEIRVEQKLFKVSGSSLSSFNVF